MKEPSLQKTTALSALIHLTFLFFSLAILKHSNNITIPSPYIVSLVHSNKAPLENTSSERMKSGEEITSPSLLNEKDIPKNKKNDKISEKIVDDRISEIASKKQIERIVKLRSMISLKGTGEQNPQKSASQNTNTGYSKGTLFDSYYSKIREEIWREWIYPDTGNKNIETIIFVKIFKDGAITVQGIERSSGNMLFDKSALKAVAKANPVTPPPYEMEIGIRFYP